jgi:hypothetical protein
MLKILLPQLRIVAAAMTVAFFVKPAAAQTDVYWSTPIQVATSTFGAASPKIGMLANGDLVAIWGKSGSSPKIYFTRKAGDNFEAPVQLNTGGISPDIYGFGGLDLAVSGNKIFIVFENFGAGIHLLRSEDGGHTFLPPTNVYTPPTGDWTTLASVTADGQGNPIVSVIRELVNETEARYIVVRSTDGGASFLPPVVASEPANGEYVCECCPSDMVVAGDSLWLVFRNNDNNLRDIWVSRSTDTGATFDTATDVDESDWVLNACPISGPRLHSIGNDSLLAVWMSGATGLGRIYAATLHGSTMEKGWQFNLTPTNANSLQSFPSIAGSGDTLCVVWEESGFGGNAGEILYSFSTTGAAGLSTYTPAMVGQATPGNQKYPDLLFENGVFHLIYQTGGALAYRRGPVAIVNSSTGPTPPKPGFELLTNPTSGHVLVKMQTIGEARFTLLDANGQTAERWQQAATSKGETLQLQLPVAIPGGIYFLKMEKDGLVWMEKLVVK